MGTMEIRVVYEASPGEDLTAAARVLKDAGCHPVTPDDPNPDEAVVYASGDTLKIRIAVPVDEEAKALEILEEWLKAGGSTDAAAARDNANFTMGFLLVVIAAAVVIWAVSELV